MIDENRGPWFRLASGRAFHFLDPRPEDIDIEDIAHGLARICRYGGHVLSPGIYSVAQHCLLVSELVEKHPAGSLTLAFEALHHDDHEAYVGDMVGPLKRVLPDFQAIEANVDRAIRAAFNLSEEKPELVHQIDTAMLAVEQRAFHNLKLHGFCDHTMRHEMDYDFPIEPMEPVVAQGFFLGRHNDLLRRISGKERA